VPNNKGGYTCKCKPNTKGRFCDQGEVTALLSEKMVEVDVDDDDETFERATGTNGTLRFLRN